MRKLLLGTLVVGTLALGGYLLLVFGLDPEAQRAALERRLHEAFGRPVTAGTMRVVVLPRFGVEMDGLSVAQDPSFGGGNVFEVRRIWANLDFWEYALHRTPVIERLSLEGTRISLVKRSDGVWNWATLGPRPAVSTLRENVEGSAAPALAAAFGFQSFASLSVDPSRVSIDRIEISDATATVVDESIEPSTETVYRGLSLVASIVPESAAYRVRGGMAADSEAMGGEPLAADLPFDALLTPPNADRPVWLAEGNIASGRLATRNLRLEPISTTFALEETQSLQLAEMNVGLFGGRLEGTFQVNLRTPGNHFTTSCRLVDVSLAEAFSRRPDVAGSVSGTVTTEFTGVGQLGDLAHTMHSIEGRGSLAILDARVASVNVLDEVARRGGFRGLTFDEPGTHVERFDAVYRARAGRLDVTSATVRSINGYASAYAESGWIDLNAPAGVDLSGSVTIHPPLFEKLKTADPAADLVLAVIGQQGSLKVPLAVKGPLESPAVAVRWEAALESFLPFGMKLPSLGH